MSRGKVSAPASGAAIAVLAVAALMLVAPARAGYWVAYEGDDFPENVGWGRSVFDANGPGGNGTPRWLDSGRLVLDSRQDHATSDSYRMARSIDPSVGETFVAEWRLLVVESQNLGDNGIGFARDQAGTLAFFHRVDAVRSQRENWVWPIEPGVPHTYRIESIDMVHYDFFVDGAYARSGVWDINSVNQSFAVFGDLGLFGGNTSLCEWDFVHFGAVPEPASQLLLLAVAATLLSRRSRGVGHDWFGEF